MIIIHSCHVFGPKILAEVERLSKLVEGHLEHSMNATLSIPATVSPQLQSGRVAFSNNHKSPNVFQDDKFQHDRHSQTSTNDSQAFSRGIKSANVGFKPQGLDEVSNWNVFWTDTTPSSSLPGLFYEDTSDTIQNSRLPDVQMSVLNRLRDRYVIGVHLKNPFLNLQQLDEYISGIVEYGLEWNIRTCLVSLVCSIGALSEPHSQSYPSDLEARSAAEDFELAIQFWNVAIHRLGFAIAAHSLEAAQCLCLAG